jgi:hypothetical protein
MTDPNARIGAYADATGLELPDGTDTFQHLQKPDLHPAGDPLAAFVKARIIDAELEPRHEFPRVYGLAAGPIAHRYAKHMREDCVVFRQIVELYLQGQEIPEGDYDWSLGAELAVRAIACRWDDHPEFDEQWRLA